MSSSLPPMLSSAIRSAYQKEGKIYFCKALQFCFPAYLTKDEIKDDGLWERYESICSKCDTTPLEELTREEFLKRISDMHTNIQEELNKANKERKKKKNGEYRELIELYRLQIDKLDYILKEINELQRDEQKKIA